jgi:hypothetical protein
VPYYICPQCKERSIDNDGREGFSRQAPACHHCGFGFLFELLDDYYPAPAAAFFACDSEGRIVDCGRGSFEFTGLRTESAIGQSLENALGLSFDDGVDHIATALEWEVRVSGKPVVVNAGAERANAVADIFPAYDDEEGGLLVVLTPSNGR